MPYQMAFCAVWLMACASHSSRKCRLRQMSAPSAVATASAGCSVRGVSGGLEGTAYPGGSLRRSGLRRVCREMPISKVVLGRRGVGYEGLQTSLELAARQQDAVVALEAAQADVRAEADHLPVGAAARVVLARADVVAHVNLDELGRAHANCSAGDRAASMADLSRFASARAAACQSDPRLAYSPLRLALTMARSPLGSTAARTAPSRSPAWAPTPGKRIGAFGTISRTRATSAG